MGRIKIRVTLVVELDAALWAEYNGIDRADVRADVRRAMLTAAQSSVLLEEAEAEVTLAT